VSTHPQPITGLHSAAGDASLRTSATIAGFDGVPIGTVTRYLEPVDDGRPADEAPAVVAVTGDVDHDTAPLLRMALTEAINGRARVRCDLGGAEFFGAAGVNTLLIAHRHAIAAGCHFSVRGAHGIAQRVLAVTGLDGYLQLED
jgi:anti-anti-sigma factor